MSGNLHSIQKVRPREPLYGEYSASQARVFLQKIFPQRQLVLSQFTFFLNNGVSSQTGEKLVRGRRCYKVEDLLSIATVLALKEEGIPLKNISNAPNLIQTHALEIFKFGPGVRLSGYADSVSLTFDLSQPNKALEAFVDSGFNTSSALFWSYDVGTLSFQLQSAICEVDESYIPLIPERVSTYSNSTPDNRIEISSSMEELKLMHAKH